MTASRRGFPTLLAIPVATPALAHGIPPDAGAADLFAAGLSAPTASPVVMLLLTAAGLLSAASKGLAPWRGLAVLAVGILAGLTATAVFIPWTGWIAHLVAAALALAVAVFGSLPALVAATAMLVAASVAAYAAFADHAGEALPAMLQSGALVALAAWMLGVHVLGAIVLTVAGERIGRLALRILASWLLAVTIMMLALGYRWNLLAV
ncbi:MAG: hypothetical protein R3D45_00985 [Rhizobiaceae bacterium]